MALDLTQPANKGKVESEPMRENFLALAIHHKGELSPENAELGFIWVDDTDPNNWVVKLYAKKGNQDATWVTLFQHAESIPEAFAAFHGFAGAQHSASPFSSFVTKVTGTDFAKANFQATTAPTVSDDVDAGYGVGSRWVDVTDGSEYLCVDATKGAADWRRMIGGGDGIPEKFEFTFQNGGAVLNTGSAISGGAYVPYACEIEEAILLADQSGSVVVDLWVDSYGNYPPTVADTITALAKPTLSSAIKSKDTTLTGWTKALVAGSFILPNIDSVSTITQLKLILVVKRT